MDKYQLTADEIRDAENARAELERMQFIKEMDKLDRDSRKLELMNKKLKIGRWAIASKLFRLNAEGFEFLREQRVAMGLPEFDPDITGLTAGVGGDTETGLPGGAAPVVGMDDTSNHRAAQDEDE